MQLNFSQTDLPLRLPDLRVTPTREQIFMFSAATWNRHKIHYSDVYAKSEGHRDIVVQRGILGNFIARQISAWLPNNAHIRRLNWRVVDSAYPDEELICQTDLTDFKHKEKSIFLQFNSHIFGVNQRLIVRANGEGEVVASNDGLAESKP